MRDLLKRKCDDELSLDVFNDCQFVSVVLVSFAVPRRLRQQVLVVCTACWRAVSKEGRRVNKGKEEESQ
jgi:hypothetical protein